MVKIITEKQPVSLSTSSTIISTGTGLLCLFNIRRNSFSSESRPKSRRAVCKEMTHFTNSDQKFFSFIHYETTLILLLATTLSFLVTFYMATLEIVELIARYSFAKTTQYTYQAREFHAIRIVVIKELNCIQHSFKIFNVSFKLTSGAGGKTALQ